MSERSAPWSGGAKCHLISRKRTRVRLIPNEDEMPKSDSRRTRNRALRHAQGFFSLELQDGMSVVARGEDGVDAVEKAITEARQYAVPRRGDARA